MVTFKNRSGDFTKKKYLYKFYKNGYTSDRPKYMTEGQYIASSREIIDGAISGNAYADGGVNGSSASIFGSGDSNTGISATIRAWSDARRKFDLKGITAIFSHGSYTTNFGSIDTYEIQLFDYIVRYTTSGNTIKAFYKTTELASATMAAGYTYIRMRESGGTFYIDRSSDGVTWTNWTSRVIDFAADTLKTVFAIQGEGGAGGLGTFSAYAENIEIVDRHNNLLAVESRPLSDLQFTETINTPASSTTIVFPYNPLDMPDHCDQGNFVEIYANFFDDGLIKNEPILDHNSQPILDETGAIIKGVVLHGAMPEEASIRRFSGYISQVDYDYDNENVAITFVSHGETASNSIVRDNTENDVPIVSQLVQNTSESTNNRRQTFTLDRMSKIDDIALRVSYGAGGGSSISIGQGNTTLATSRSYVWSGGLPATVLTYHFENSVYLEAGTYWVKENGGISWYYQNADVLAGGSRQQYSGGNWSNVTGDAYMQIFSAQPNFSLDLSGDSSEVAQQIYDQSLALDYSPLSLDIIEATDYDINIGLNIDSAKNALAALYRQLPTGWFYKVDVGKNTVTIKNKNADPDHLLIFGRHFTGMKVTKDINGIINDVYYIGGQLTEAGDKLTVRYTDTDSIGDLRQGVAILSNDKVTRYDSAQLLAENTVNNNNGPRISTEITLSAAKYNTESVHIGDVVKIANGDQDVLGTTLVVANIDYAPAEITISLDSAPRNISRTIDAINRQLEIMSTAGASPVV